MNTSRIGVVVWFTGLPASGKSTLAWRVRDLLSEEKVSSCVLDGDDIRQALFPSPGYSPRERRDFYRTLANLAGLLARQGQIVLVAATAHRRSFRDYAREQAPRFVEVHVASSLEECRERDVKQTYSQATAKNDNTVPGLGAAYEPPTSPDVVARGGLDEAAPTRIVLAIESRGKRARFEEYESE